MADVKQRRMDRLRVMAAIYQEVGADTQNYLDLRPLRDALGFSEEYTAELVAYLEGEDLIGRLRLSAGQKMPTRACITHKGVKEMEASEESPEEPTQYFPPQSSINFYGNVAGAAIQLASPGATQRLQVGDIKISGETDGQIRAFLTEYDARLTALQREWPPEALAEIAPRVSRVRREIEAPNSDRHLVKDTLTSIRSIMENGVGGVVTQGLLLLLSQIHW